MSPTAVVIGNFDGVHSGHRALLRSVREQAPPGAEVVVVTFWPHPLAVLRPEANPPMLTDLRERLALLKQAGADRVEVLPFDREVAGWSPEEFVDRVLLPLQPAVVMVGENFCFGKNAAGDVETLSELGVGKFDVQGLELYCPEGTRPASSTRVRNALAAGQAAEAATMLGRPFRVSGVVVQGAQRGRELGFPTANLPAVTGWAIPADGIYAGWLTRLDRADAPVWPAAISVGTNPTFDGVARTVEAYVLDRTDLELYDVEVAVDFVEHIRGQVKYTGPEDLIEQMHHDVAQCREILLGQQA